MNDKVKIAIAYSSLGLLFIGAMTADLRFALAGYFMLPIILAYCL